LPVHGLLCASAFLQVVVVASFQRPARDGNSDVGTKPLCSGLLQPRARARGEIRKKKSMEQGAGVVQEPTC